MTINILKRLLFRLFPRKLLIYRGKADTLYITFDDGPHPEVTVKLLEVLKRHNARATFFFTGSALEAHPEIGRRAAAEGHNIGNHSYSHRKDMLKKFRSISAEYKKTGEIMERSCAVNTGVFRPPHGILNLPLFHFSIRHGVPLIMWSFDSGDDLLKDGAKISERLRGVHGGDIVLFHDDCKATVEVLGKWVDEKAGQGYRFGLISELL